MFTVDGQVDVHCPRCANDTVYVQTPVTLVPAKPETYWYRCGKCDFRFRVDAEPILGPPVQAGCWIERPPSPAAER